MGENPSLVATRTVHAGSAAIISNALLCLANARESITAPPKLPKSVTSP